MANAVGSEKELAALIIAYLRDDSYEIYQECPFNGAVADIVAVRGPLVCVVETKVNLGLSVIEQCVGWLHYANIVYAGVWKPKRAQTTFGRNVAAKYGIGTIEVSDPKYGDRVVSENIKPEFRRKILPGLRNALRSEMMSGEYGEAGTRSGGRFTPFRETCEQLLAVVRSNPGIQLKAAIESIKRHHYASNAACRANLRKYIENGVIKGLTHTIENGKFVLNPVL